MAVVEGICFALYDVLQVVQNSSQEITQLNVSGGFVQSEVWVQLLADVTGKKLLLIQEQDASSIGAVFLCAKTLEVEFTFSSPDAQVISPNLSKHERYQKIFPIFKELYHTLSPLMKKVQHLNL